MTSQLTYLFRLEAPWITIGPGEAERVRWNPAQFYTRPGQNVCVRRLRGQKMRNSQGLMDEFGAALQFCDDFGENWYALKECLEYIDEWLRADVYILVVERAELMLSEADAAQMAALLKTLHEVGEWWSAPIANNGRFNRDAIPFHTLLNSSADDAAYK